MDDNQDRGDALKNVAIVVVFFIIVILVATIAISNIFKQAHTSQNLPIVQNTIPTAPPSSPTPSIMDTSNGQLDKDVQTINNTLQNVDTSIKKAQQSINNQSAETPQ